MALELCSTLSTWVCPGLLELDITDEVFTDALSVSPVSEAVSDWSPIEGHASLSRVSTIMSFAEADEGDVPQAPSGFCQVPISWLSVDMFSVSEENY